MPVATPDDTPDASPPRTDYGEIRALFVKGFTLKDLAQRYGLKYESLRSRSSRERWAHTVAVARHTVAQGVNMALRERATGWVGKIDSYVNRHLEHLATLDPSATDPKTLKTLVETAEIVDRMARRTYGLDEQNTPGATHLHVHAAAPPVATDGLADCRVIDLTPVKQAEPVSSEPSPD